MKFENIPFLFHGSYDDENIPEVGDTLSGREEEYEKDWQTMGYVYKRLEELRPEDCIAHKNAVFMCDNVQDIDNCGGGTDIVMIVIPYGDVFRHDLSWLTLAEMALEENDHEAIDSCIKSYWAGERNEGVFEYLARGAFIIKSLDFDDEEITDYETQLKAENPELFQKNYMTEKVEEVLPEKENEISPSKSVE